MKILVVDDNAVAREMLQDIMNSFGECEVAESGGAAITTFKKARDDMAPFDLIILDISMPDMDGVEVLLKIRNIENIQKYTKLKLAKVMMVTASADKETVVRCIEAGCDSYVVKPFKKEDIINKLQTLGFKARREIGDV